MGLNPVPIPTGKSEGKIDKARLSEGPNFQKIQKEAAGVNTIKISPQNVSAKF